jgi:hypothetical protein
MFYSVQQVVCNFLSLTNGSSWFIVIKVIASSTRVSKHMVNKNMADNKGRKSGEIFWTKEQMEDLLHHYENEVELWDISNSNYSKKDTRQRALERIKEALDNNFTGKILLRCMHVLVIIILYFVF